MYCRYHQKKKTSGENYADMILLKQKNTATTNSLNNKPVAHL